MHIFDMDWDTHSGRHVDAIFKICNVSHDWRTVAHTTPSLWSIVDVDLAEDNCKSSKQVIKDWIGQSGAVPLYVRLDVEPYPSGVVKRSARNIVQSILVHAERYRAFEISSLPNSDQSLQILKSIEHLRLLHYKIPRFTLHLKAAPTILIISPTYFSRISIDWTQLPVIKFTLRDDADDCTIETLDCLRLFRMAPRLVSCSIADLDSLSHEDPLTQQGTNVNHTLLHILEFDTCAPEDLWTFISLPNLKVLRIDSFDDGNDGTFGVFQERCGCSSQA